MGIYFTMLLLKCVRDNLLCHINLKSLNGIARTAVLPLMILIAIREKDFFIHFC